MFPHKSTGEHSRISDEVSSNYNLKLAATKTNHV